MAGEGSEKTRDQRDRKGNERKMSGRDDRLGDLITAYLDRLNDGERLERSDILAAHPELGPAIILELETFLAPEATSGSAAGPQSDDNRVLGDYQLLRRVGRGGMGIVYEAWQNSMDRRVALKILPAGVALDTNTVTRFLREARIAGQLHHPNVVSVFGTGVKGDVSYYAMEFVDGETLAQILGRMKDAKPEEKTPFGVPRDDLAYYSTLARLIADVAEGLQHAHSNGIIYRDIKPSNLILDRGGCPPAGAADMGGSRLRILDFGLARLEGQESLTISGDIVGTLLYMSPEQARAKKIPIDHRTDIYSLGATLYELLTLCPPFKGKDHQDTLSQIIERDPVEPRKLNPRVPKDLETMVLKCLRKEPSDRYGTAEALAQDLRRFVHGDPIEARPQPAWEKLSRRLWRQKGRLLAGLIAVLLLLASALLVQGHYRDVRRRSDELYRQTVLGAIMKLQVGQMLVNTEKTLANPGRDRLSMTSSVAPVRKLFQVMHRDDVWRADAG